MFGRFKGLDRLFTVGDIGSVAFAMVAIMISVGSALLLSAARRRAEIGIMRSFGISRRKVDS